MTERFRKKPVEVEAVHYDGSFPLEFLGPGDDVGLAGNGSDTIIIRTLEGEMRAEIGDWIVKGVQGEFYPVKPDIFEATYESANVPAATADRLQEAERLLRDLRDRAEKRRAHYGNVNLIDFDPGLAADIKFDTDDITAFLSKPAPAAEMSDDKHYMDSLGTDAPSGIAQSIVNGASQTEVNAAPAAPAQDEAVRELAGVLREVLDFGFHRPLSQSWSRGPYDKAQDVLARYGSQEGAQA